MLHSLVKSSLRVVNALYVVLASRGFFQIKISWKYSSCKQSKGIFVCYFSNCCSDSVVVWGY
jgi:hypothetical protein